ncbi:hypothetical protein [Algibacter sp. R77976]|uniref:hypothetical protein n=1 Tax=Algibacter sp. R77976 TaxID=3093873 RepID=UPI0037C839F4
MTLNRSLLFILCICVFSCNIEPYEEDVTSEEIEEVDETEEEEEETTDYVLLKQLVYNKGTVDEYTETFNYDGNKLTSVDYGDGYKNVYTYDSNDKLIKDEWFADNELEASVDLEYNSDGEIASYIENFYKSSGLDERQYKNIFIHNSDGTITKEVYLSIDGSDFEIRWTETITFEGLNILEIANDDDFKQSYTYDDKNNAFKNIHAIEILNFLTENEFGTIIYGNTNNIISRVDSDTSTTDSFLDNYRYEYTYNENNYPISCTYTSEYSDGNIDVETIEYFYE